MERQESGDARESGVKERVKSTVSSSPPVDSRQQERVATKGKSNQS